ERYADPRLPRRRSRGAAGARRRARGRTGRAGAAHRPRGGRGAGEALLARALADRPRCGHGQARCRPRARGAQARPVTRPTAQAAQAARARGV
ncbi:MAG: hypothetical protein AVDCRST_MAG53-3151, partial [uncultured Solirubrobacteraceae bacterium]